MRLRIAVTDNEWFRFLRSQLDIDRRGQLLEAGRQHQPFYGLNPCLRPETFITGERILCPLYFLCYPLGPRSREATSVTCERP
jgi:hypothetical protein